MSLHDSSAVCPKNNSKQVKYQIYINRFILTSIPRKWLASTLTMQRANILGTCASTNQEEIASLTKHHNTLGSTGLMPTTCMLEAKLFAWVQYWVSTGPGVCQCAAAIPVSVRNKKLSVLTGSGWVSGIQYIAQPTFLQTSRSVRSGSSEQKSPPQCSWQWAD